MKQLFKFSFLLLLSLNLKAQVPTATIVSPTVSLCSGLAITFTTTTTNTPTAFSWSIIPSTSVTIFPDKLNSFINLTFARGGVYTLSLQVSNGSGSTAAVKTVTINQSANASFNASLHGSGFPSQMILTNFSTGGISNSWNYSDDPTVNTTFDDIKNYKTSGNYSITLIEYGAGGCNDTSLYAFRVSDSSGVSLPNIFTPNDDGVNDVFKPVTRGITTLKAYIYNRYGTLVYSWDKPNGFWDGYTTSGELCLPGTYFCVLEAKGFDGRSIKLKGQLTLFR